jgi:hypothetical protein
VTALHDAVVGILNKALDRAIDSWTNDGSDETSIPLAAFLMDALAEPVQRATIRRYLDELDVDQDFATAETLAVQLDKLKRENAELRENLRGTLFFGKEA